MQLKQGLEKNLLFQVYMLEWLEDIERREEGDLVEFLGQGYLWKQNCLVSRWFFKKIKRYINKIQLKKIFKGVFQGEGKGFQWK